MGKRIIHSTRALFLTFLALEKVKEIVHFMKILPQLWSGKIVPQQYIPKGRDKIYSGNSTSAVNAEKSGQDLHRNEKRSTPEQKIVLIPKV
jgi:hypothetical protein